MQKISFVGRLERNQGATMFFITGKKKKQLLVFDKKLLILYKMETQKNINCYMIQAMKNLNLLQKLVCHRQSKSKR